MNITLESEPVDYNFIYVIIANEVEYKTYVPETVTMYKAILDKFKIEYKVEKRKNHE